MTTCPTCGAPSYLSGSVDGIRRVHEPSPLDQLAAWREADPEHHSLGPILYLRGENSWSMAAFRWRGTADGTTTSQTWRGYGASIREAARALYEQVPK